MKPNKKLIKKNKKNKDKDKKANECMCEQELKAFYGINYK